jgi:hypothetical protein
MTLHILAFPKPPFGLELQDPTETEVTIIWNAPIETPVEGQTDMPVVKIEGYKIYARFKTSPNNWVKGNVSCLFCVLTLRRCL